MISSLDFIRGCSDTIPSKFSYLSKDTPDLFVSQYNKTSGKFKNVVDNGKIKIEYLLLNQTHIRINAQINSFGW